jgi:cephalosporin hydroxylase
MNYVTRMRLARLVRFFRPQPSKIALSVEDVLRSSSALNVVDQFNKLYYESGAARNLQWRGIEILKNPCDLWMMLELICRVRPSVLVETGTHCGGSALYFAEMAGLLGQPCSVITVDINPKLAYDPGDYNIFPVVGYSTERRVTDTVSSILQDRLRRRPGPVMVTLDSDHTQENVARELDMYSSHVTPGSYLIVEDTNVNGHPASPDHGPGPWEAVHDFLSRNHGFEIDPDCQRHLLTFFPDGWLRRLASSS